MKIVRTLLLLFALAALTLPFAAHSPANAQGGSPFVQVWYFGQTDQSPALVEYRDSAGTLLVSYALATDSINGPRQANGFVFGWDSTTLPYFDPYAGMVIHHLPPNKPADTDSTFYNLSEGIPNNTGQFAYTITQIDSQAQTPALNWVYVATPGQNNDTQILQMQSPDAWTAIQPFGWSDDGSTVMLHNMPQGIGGYILFWTYKNVQGYNVANGTTSTFGDIDGFSGDLTYTAVVEAGADGLTGLRVTTPADNLSTFYPLPPLAEMPITGGGVHFSPFGTKVAYQVARANPEAEKFWTIVVDLATGQSSVVLEDEAPDYEVTYGYIGGWLDENTLVVGGPWNQKSVVIDVTSSAVLREELGAFLGYAHGIMGVSNFAPAGTAYSQCPDSPPSRLTGGMTGRITITGGGMTNVRLGAGLQGEVIGQQPEGATFQVYFGPVCKDGYAWWNVGFGDGTSGFVAEGDFTTYYLEPWQ